MRETSITRYAAIGAIAVAGIAGTAIASTGSDNAWPYDGTRAAPVLSAVGDVSCEPDGDVTPEPSSTYLCNDTRNAAQVATARQIGASHPDLVAILGDEQYQVGRLNDFERSFDPTYGAFKYLQRPAPGNHEFYDYKDGEKGTGGAGYFAYYNGYQTTATGSPVLDANGNPVPLADGQAALPVTAGTPTTSAAGI